MLGYLRCKLLAGCGGGCKDFQGFSFLLSFGTALPKRVAQALPWQFGSKMNIRSNSRICVPILALGSSPCAQEAGSEV